MKARTLLAIGMVLMISMVAVAQDKIIIGHRGAAGYLPEETLAGYAFGYALGADYLEPDLVLTKDGHFICLHDIYLEPTTNVEQIFPDRHRSDRHWYVADFTLAEIKTLSVHERCKENGSPYFPDRFPVGKSKFEVPTFIEMIQLVQGLNKSTGRDVGLYPELKRPAWHESQGLPMEQAFLDILDKYGYTKPGAKIFIQCFEPSALQKLHELGTKIPLVQLISANWSFAGMWTKSGLEQIATYANGIGSSKTIIENNPAFVQWAHDRGLVVHPYVFRRDELPVKYSSLEQEMKQFYFTYNVDGLFTDFVDIAVAVLAGN